MVNINAEIKKALDSVATSFYGLPRKEAKMPCISFFEMSNTSALDADNEELESKIVYQIDVWADKGKDKDFLARKVHKAMKHIGGHRQNCLDVVEEKNYHKLMEYVFCREYEEV